jgi:hypothetical protein
VSSLQTSTGTSRPIVNFLSSASALALGVMLVVIALCPAAFAAFDMCSGGILDQGAPLGQTGPDLVITNMTCTVDGTKAPYNFHNVYIFGTGMQTGTLTFSNASMDFYAANILVQNGGALQATGIGTNGETLTIHLYGNPSDPGVTCKMIQNGNVVDDPTCGVPTSNPDVWDSNKMDMHYPMSCTKTSQLSPPTTLPGGVDDCFYQYGVFDNNDIAGAYFGHKVLALSYGGTINFSGYKGAQGGDDSNPAITGSSWLRLNATLKGTGSENSLTISSPVTDWKHGDHIVVTATDYLPGHAEDLVVDNVTGTTVTLESPVTNPHWGQTYSLANVPCTTTQGSTSCEIGPDLLPGQMPKDRNVDVRAAVGLLTRSIRIVSDGGKAGDPFGATGYFGGHTVVRQGFLSYQVQGVEFYQLGQGGAKGHYPVHFHVARKTPAGTYIKDSSVWDSMTRWITIHATQGVTLARNVGYKSIGHGFYLEDGSEADNVLNTNLGVFARAAVINGQNPRNVPGILAAPGNPGSDVPPYHSDWEHPTVFWIMNGWNEFQYNFASSAGTCGVCYWLLPGGISGPSQYEYFEGYAGQQVVIPWDSLPGLRIDRSGRSPLEKFVGNSCSVAMTSFLNIGSTTACNGVSNNGNAAELQAINNPAAPPNGPVGADPYYAYVGGLRNATLCAPGVDCSSEVTDPTCSAFGPAEANCVVTTLERYTTSFNWAQKNFAAVWLRPWWFLMENSAITDVQQGGLTFVTSGGYTRADVAQGYWSLLRKSALVGNTQPITQGDVPANQYASNGGPFNPTGLSCDQPGPPLASYCLSKAQGISFPTELYSVNQKLFSIYDGPAFQERNAYLDITSTKIGQGENCVTTADGVQRTCPSFKWLYGIEIGLPADPASPSGNPSCYLPNAAIAWKQSNGFFYPPAFHSDNLFFQNVDIRHFVIEPLFNFGTFITSPGEVKKRYCTWRTDMFNNFTDVDRQTVLNDDDGSLTGLLGDLGQGQTRETISVNEDSFFNAPKVTIECASDIHDTNNPATNPPGTANTSPYEYVTTATIAACGINRGGCNGYWGPDCSAGSGPTACYGVPLYRQYLTDAEYTKYTGDPTGYHRPAVRLMGQATGQRSTLTVNHGKYYIDDQVTQATQQQSATNLNVYQGGQTYYTYFVYGKPGLHQIYQMFVGYGLDKKLVLGSVHQFRVILNDQAYMFNPADSDPSFINPTYDDRPLPDGTGLLTVEVNLSAYADEFKNDTPQFCQPRSYCAPSQSDQSKCVCAPGSECTDDSVCRWGINDIDCPLKGCFAYGVTLPNGFATGLAKPPAPGKFTDDPDYSINWGIPWDLVDLGISGKQCHYTMPPD